MKLSIIIPTLQEEKMIEKVLISLKELKGFEYEIIVSDGHSTDRTAEIAKKYADHVVVHDGKTRQTIAQGRNDGARIAQGEFLVFLDSDVFICNINLFFSRAITDFEKDKELIALTGKLKTLPEYETLGDKISWSIVSHFHQFINNVLHTGSSSGEFQMFRAEVFRKVKGYNETLVFGEDAEIFTRLSKIGKVRSDMKLCVMHTSRRAHNIGWTSLWFEWSINVISNLIRKKPIVKEWKVSR
jgi:glycosyltransferase involved in cell wall biosynthesis